MSLNHCYTVLLREGLFYTVAYYLAVPTLLFVQFLGCGKEPFNRRSIDKHYFQGYLPADPPPYNEYLEILKYVHEIKTVEVRDAEFA